MFLHKYIKVRKCLLKWVKRKASVHSAKKPAACELPQAVKGEHSLDPCILAPGTQQPKVAIIGGGLAGLSAAKRLSQCGITNFSILEATERPGGRILSGWLGDAVIEIGSDKIEGACIANPIYRLAASDGILDAACLPKEERPRGLMKTPDGKEICDWELEWALWSAIDSGARKAELDRCAQGQSKKNLLGNFLAIRTQQQLLTFPQNERLDRKRVLNNLNGLIRTRWGRDLQDMCAVEYGSLERYPGGAVALQAGLVGVLGPLIRSLRPSNILYEKAVRQVDWDPGRSPRVIVRCVDGDNFMCDYALITVPLGVLKSNKCFFTPMLPQDKRQAIDELKVGHITKIFLEYERPWWNPPMRGWVRFAQTEGEARQEGGWLSAVFGVEEVPGSRATLVLTCSGEEALTVEQCAEELVAVDITRHFRRWLSDSSLPFPKTVLMSHWGTDPNFLGALSSIGPVCQSHLRNCLSCPHPIDSKPPVLLFAGEATSKHSFGTMQGAYSSGQREAENIIKYTQELRGPPQAAQAAQ